MKKEEYLYYNENDYELYKGKMQDVLNTFEANSVDSIVCDPPYKITSRGSSGTMGGYWKEEKAKLWDNLIEYNKNKFEEINKEE